jgi:hypothetical protein
MQQLMGMSHTVKKTGENDDGESDDDSLTF